MNIESLRWKKYPVLNDGFICLVDAMGDDSSIVQAARVSYGNDLRLTEQEEQEIAKELEETRNPNSLWGSTLDQARKERIVDKKDRALIRYLLNHSHTTPFEMVELKFLVRVPMDCWRQWIRHRTANVNEYSTRYTEAIDSQQTTSPQEWRLQATDNKQGSSGYLDKRIDEIIESPQEAYELFGIVPISSEKAQEILSDQEQTFHNNAQRLYQSRLAVGIAKEQARKDLPLSTYTEAYWKCDLHNIFNFLRLRMDNHAQYEIRMYANAMYEIVKQVVPVACEAFEDYVLNAKKFSRMEMVCIKSIVTQHHTPIGLYDKRTNMTDREWKEFLEKLQ